MAFDSSLQSVIDIASVQNCAAANDGKSHWTDPECSAISFDVDDACNATFGHQVINNYAL